MQDFEAMGISWLKVAPIRDLGVDETSFQKRHEYVTVIDILDDREKATLKGWLENNQRHLQQLRSVSMDMWEAYINAVTEVIEGAEQLICFERFHVAADFGKAVDKVRAAKHHVVARMVRRYLWGIINAIILRVTNASAESINAKIQKIKAIA